MSEREQEWMDRLLRDAMAGPAPRLSPGFEARMAQRLRPRGLSSTARWAMALYTAIALLVTIWATRDLPELRDWLGQWVAPGVCLALVPLSFAWTLRRLERSARTPR